MNYILRGWFQGLRTLWCRAIGGPYVAAGLSDRTGQTGRESPYLIRSITEDCCDTATPELGALEASTGALAGGPRPYPSSRSDGGCPARQRGPRSGHIGPRASPSGT